ncbi:adenosylmethionine--8-amino-7-oxononanoate transaminase [Thiomicrorhabdus cannonii]|uniref:adenosylmethionine--8-amino-7-oxononanoate transaminase n=1 Tax=Thiomicrorhabdus cannonii TaxID=2748011 RepID=UPI0015C1BDBC|nr:adenosylmethionine--8-amino-7-oxononanoate transaminase [Thiomicrorhabdus cannonii]
MTHHTASDWPALLDFDQQHLWHPYAKMPAAVPAIGVTSTLGSRIRLADGREVIDGMSSWWAAIHGYNHPSILQAMHKQLDTMPHIMFGGLTHEPAIELAKRLVQLSPDGLEKVFLADSGSVSMEVAIKIALQYWISLNRPEKHRLLTVRNGYHGDTFATMAVSDPENGMHSLFSHTLKQHLFAPAPHMGFDFNGDDSDIAAMENLLKQHHPEIAAITIEPIVQGAGGMRFYRPDYLKQLRMLCDRYEVLLIVDEIATGFGRTGQLFACNWAGISPDIMCVGKALTGGTMTLAATLCTANISDVISAGSPGLLMHGPTFMGNPLACAAANASIDLLLSSPWQSQVQAIEGHLKTTLSPLRQLSGVADVRVLGAIGVVELVRGDLGPAIQAAALNENVWLRPFGKLVYTMPAFNIPQHELEQLTQGMTNAITTVLNPSQP